VIAGATSAGAALIVRPAANITQPQDLGGKKIASRNWATHRTWRCGHTWLRTAQAHWKKAATPRFIPTDNPLILDLFRQGQIDGAWVRSRGPPG